MCRHYDLLWPHEHYLKKYGTRIWSRSPQGGRRILYIDLHLVHEVTSPQAFDGLRANGRRVRQPLPHRGHRRPQHPDHAARHFPSPTRLRRSRLKRCRKIAASLAFAFFDMDSPEQGIVHVIGPELGITLPGMTIVCGDSHTSTHGAFGALAFGIGTSEVEHVLATQCLPQQQPKTMQIHVSGKLAEGVTAKDLALGIIGQHRHRWRHRIRDRIRRRCGARAFDGRPHDAVQHEHRGGSASRNGCARRDDHSRTSKGRRFAPKGKDWEEAVAYWRTAGGRSGAEFDE